MANNSYEQGFKDGCKAGYKMGVKDTQAAHNKAIGQGMQLGSKACAEQVRNRGEDKQKEIDKLNPAIVFMDETE